MPLIDKKTRSFTEVYSNYYPLVFSSVYAKINNVDDVKDICQEVFIRYYDKFEGIESPRKWLLGTLRYVVLEFYRRKGTRDITIGELFDDIGMTYVNGFRDTRIIIQEALEDISNFENEREKILFDLIAVDNYTYKETGEILGLTEHKVRYRYGLIVNRILDYLSKKGIKGLEDLL